MTPTELLDSARTTTRDRLAEVDTAALRDSAASNLAAARETAAARLHDAGHLLDEAGHFLEAKVDEASDALEDDDTRNTVAIVAGVTGVLVLLWAVLRRRRAKREAELEEALYESTMDGVPGWNDPRSDKVDLPS